MVRSPLTFEISVASNLAFQRAMVTPSSNGRTTSVGSSAMASSRNRTDRPEMDDVCAAAGSDIPRRTLAVDGLARDAEPARCLLAVAAGFLQDGQDVSPLDV